MIDYNDPRKDNYYAFLLALVYPYYITPDEAIDAIKHGIKPLVITEQTLTDAHKLSGMQKIPDYFAEYTGRRREVVQMLSEIINETNRVMQSLRDYELSRYREDVLAYMIKLRERMVKESIR